MKKSAATLNNLVFALSYFKETCKIIHIPRA